MDDLLYIYIYQIPKLVIFQSCTYIRTYTSSLTKLIDKHRQYKYKMNIFHLIKNSIMRNNGPVTYPEQFEKKNETNFL